MSETTIPGVLRALDDIVDAAVSSGSRLGYFPALYRNVTDQVAQGIARGDFQDGPRMEALDVVFANRYLDAYDAWTRGQPCSRCWQVAFDAAAGTPPLAIQHLLLGMNAHISFDLGIAAQQVAPGSLPALEADFLKINRILSSLVDGVQDRLDWINRGLLLVDRLFGSRDEALATRTLGGARDRAWTLALALDAAEGLPRERLLASWDGVVAMASRALEGRLLARPLVLVGGWLESSDVAANIRMLQAPLS